MDKTKVIYTLEPHYDAGLFDNTEDEWKEQRTPHEGFLLSWEHESRIGSYGEQDVITVGVIEDATTHELITIPKNRIQIINLK